jgi:hypothetical protein
MSETQELFIKELCEKFDEKYKRMSHLLLTVIGIILSSALIIGFSQVSSAAEVKRQQVINTAAIEYIMSNSVSQKAIDLLIVSFENQTVVMEKYLPGDVNGAMQEFNRVSGVLRSNIMMFNSSLNNRGANE